MTEKKLKILALLSCEWGNPERCRAGKFKKVIYYFEFSYSGFPHWEDKRARISKKCSVVFYPIFIYILVQSSAVRGEENRNRFSKLASFFSNEEKVLIILEKSVSLYL